MDRPDGRAGYALLATLLVVVAALAILAAVLGPSVVSVVDTARLEYAREALTAWTDAPDHVVRFEDHVNRYPGALSQLSRPITGTDTDVCGRAYTPGQVGSWDGPYVDRVMPETGTPIRIGVAGDTLEILEISPSEAYFVIPVHDVRVEAAGALDRAVDGTVDSGGGRVRWDPPTAEGLVLLRWLLPVDRCPGPPGGGGGPPGGGPGG